MNDSGRGFGGLHLGSASLLTLFAVLCLTVLSALSLTSAKNEETLAHRAADATALYYAADAKAATIYDAVTRGDMQGVTVTPNTSDGVYCRYAVPMGDTQQLEVELDKNLQILSWRAVYTALWQPDEGIDIWDGNLPEVQ
ncbi:hypothetical protein SDC9_59875 [bioreactor metagenome]|uniref:Type 4 fimbrial biogenesis protein PilX N-terminal domain-containing protein n=1 Tax=bioreactor metagenome TaxID=1076179 RepID=A0A644XCK7_9ZZZZ